MDLSSPIRQRPVESAEVGAGAGLNWQNPQATLFYHEVKPKPGTQVVITAGGNPILILGTYGKGRIALWTATLHGEPADPASAYWRWAEWPKLVRNVTAWLAGKG